MAKMTVTKTAKKGPIHGALNPVKVKAAGGKTSSTPAPRQKMGVQVTAQHGPYASMKIKAAGGVKKK